MGGIDFAISGRVRARAQFCERGWGREAALNELIKNDFRQNWNICSVRRGDSRRQWVRPAVMASFGFYQYPAYFLLRKRDCWLRVTSGEVDVGQQDCCHLPEKMQRNCQMPPLPLVGCLCKCCWEWHIEFACLNPCRVQFFWPSSSVSAAFGLDCYRGTRCCPLFLCPGNLSE